MTLVLTLSNDNTKIERRKGSRFSKVVSEERAGRRRWIVIGANLASPSLLCLSMARMGAGLDLLPWYLCAVGLSIFSLAQLTSSDDFTAALLPSVKEPVKFSETFALSFFLVSLVIWVSGLTVQKAPPAQIAQVVDIQFISPHDASDLDSPLPGSTSQTITEVRRRHADEVTMQGNPSPVVAQPPAVPLKLEKPQEKQARPSPKKDDQQMTDDSKQDIKKVAPEKRVATRVNEPSVDSRPPLPAPEKVSTEDKPAPPQETTLLIPASWSTRKADAPVSVAATRSQPSSRPAPLIAEVEPPEMVELMENEGDSNAVQVFQRGGDSTGGRGKENGLSRYLKELHRKIKAAWNPPKGTSRKVVLIFRIRRDGSLVQVRVTDTSGEQDVDRSAIGAIMGATRKPAALPVDYHQDYLDILYTFNYNVDELEEVKH